MRRIKIKGRCTYRHLLCVAIFFGCFFQQSILAQGNSKKITPNIIFILADDLGYGDVGCYGQQKILTPNIDALAKSGMRFTQFYSGSTVCAPARASFMTGLHTGHTPIRGNVTYKPEGQTPLPESAVTIAMKLKTAGYKTAAIGKWSLGFVTTSGAPSKKGFDHFYGYNCQSLAHNYYPDHVWEDDKRIDFPENLIKPTVYSADLFQQKALEYIDAQKNNQPFFLYLPYTLPHVDLTAPHDSIYNFYRRMFSDEQPLAETDKRNLNKQFVELYPHAAFASMVARLDKYVGEIAALVNKKGLAENTIIIFASDNGPHKEKGGDPEFFGGAGIYRGIKRDLYEGGIRVPLIVSWKGKIKPAQQSDAVIALWDFFPTFMQAAGQVANDVDGISFYPTLLGKPQKKNDYLYWEFHEEGGKQAVRWKNWKLIKLNVSSTKENIVELYDLKSDPSEKVNVAKANESIVKKMEAMVKEAHQENEGWKFLPQEK